jgi:hypothetical protein
MKPAPWAVALGLGAPDEPEGGVAQVDEHLNRAPSLEEG